MNQAIYRAISTLILGLGEEEYTLEQTTLQDEIMALLGIDRDSSDTEKLGKVLKYVRSEHITNLPRITILADVIGVEGRSIKFLDEKYVRIRVESNDGTGRINEQILGKIRELIDGYTPNKVASDNVSYWSEFTWKREGKPPYLHADVYDLYHEYVIIIAPKKNRKIL